MVNGIESQKKKSYKKPKGVMYIEKQYHIKCDVGRRIAAYLIDHIILSFMLVGFIICAVMTGEFTLIILSIIGAIIIYTGKDLFGGRSLGKRALNMAVRKLDNTDEVPGKWRLFLRNITLIIWPIELIVLLARDDNRRLGDMIAGTTVIRIVNEKIVIKKRTIVIGVVLGVVIIVGTSILFFTGIAGIMKNNGAYTTTIEYIESSEEIENRIGDIEGYGFIPSGSVNITNGYGEAVLVITVKGEKETVKIYSELKKGPGSEWQIIQINYFE